MGREWCRSSTTGSCHRLCQQRSTLGQAVTDAAVPDALLSLLQLLEQPKLADDS